MLETLGITPSILFGVIITIIPYILLGVIKIRTGYIKKSLVARIAIVQYLYWIWVLSVN
jgi:hypothetical protein